MQQRGTNMDAVEDVEQTATTSSRGRVSHNYVKKKNENDLPGPLPKHRKTQSTLFGCQKVN